MTAGRPAAAAPPVVPAQFRAIQDLGPARVVAAVPRSRRAGYSIGMLVAWGISILLGGFVIALFAQLALQFDDVVFLGIAAVLWVAGFVAVAWWLRRKGAQVVVLYADGIAVGDGRAVRRWRWEDFVSVERRPVVHEVKPDLPIDLASAATAVAVVAVLATLKATNRPTVRVHSYYRFFDRSGGSFGLDRWLPAVDDLAAAIELEITDRLAPAARAALADGRTVAFGGVALRRDVLVVGERAIAMSALEDLVVDKDVVHVIADGGTQVDVPVAGIANLTLLLELSQELRSANG